MNGELLFDVYIKWLADVKMLSKVLSISRLFTYRLRLFLSFSISFVRSFARSFVRSLLRFSSYCKIHLLAFVRLLQSR